MSNFTMQDSVLSLKNYSSLLILFVATPYPGGFKCFTCEKAADNYECNRWAPDIYCPRGKLSVDRLGSQELTRSEQACLS